MKQGFRQSMAWLHTWSGLLVGWVLFLVFATGTAAYFRDEISLWMRPELHAASTPNRIDPAAAAEQAMAFLGERAPRSQNWFIDLPTARDPATRVLWFSPPPPGESGGPRRRRFENAMLDPVTGAMLEAPRETRGGDFFYRVHFDLHYVPAVWGRWIVGFCAMFMLVAIISGIVTHKRIFKDFFTFRPKKGQRSWLDAHNASAVLALPYHLMITYTGLVTLMFLYMSPVPQALYRGDMQAFNAEAFPSFRARGMKPSGESMPLAPIAPMLAAANAHWHGAPVGRVSVNFPGDASALVTLTRQDTGGISIDRPAMVFSGATGALVSTHGDAVAAAAETRGVFYGLHVARFAQPLLRWLFFLSGLAGCAMVATGLLLWAVKERQKHAKTLAKGGSIGWGLRLVDGLNLGTIAGVPLAMAAYLWANRLLPAGLAERAQMEIHVFFAAWGLALLAGIAWPARPMWRTQLGLGAALFAGVPLLQVFAGGAHLGLALPAGLWRIAGVDLACLALGAGLAAAVWWLGHKGQARKPRQAS